MPDTIFHKIIKREIPAEILYEDDECIAIKDIVGVAPVHFLVIPKESIDMLSKAEKKQQMLLGHLLLVANKVAKEQELNGYRVVINSGSEGGQTVFQLHIHVIGGRKLEWPPG